LCGTLFLLGREMGKTSTIKPIEQQLVPTHASWIKAYGDGLDVQIAYNTVYNRQLISKVFERLNIYHPIEAQVVPSRIIVADPNN